jgi:hypothetical protein
MATQEQTNLGIELTTNVGIRSDSLIDDWATEIYEHYPRKVGRPKAIQSIKKALGKVSVGYLLGITKQYAIAVANSDPLFIPHPTTWFNQERYNDNPSTWPRIGKGAGRPSRHANTSNDGRAAEDYGV